MFEQDPRDRVWRHVWVIRAGGEIRVQKEVDNAEVIVNVTGELKKTVSTKPVSPEQLGCIRQVVIANITGQLQVMFEYVQ